MKDKNKKVAWLLKGMVVIFALIGLWVYIRLVPSSLETTIIEDVTGMMSDIKMTNSYRTYLTNAYYIMIALFACTGIPCYITLLLVWKMADTIEKERAFVMENSKRLAWIAKLSILNLILGVAVITVFWILLDMHSELIYLMMSACLFALPFSVVVWALSYMVEKASDLQLESDYTI